MWSQHAQITGFGGESRSHPLPWSPYKKFRENPIETSLVRETLAVNGKQTYLENGSKQVLKERETLTG